MQHKSTRAVWCSPGTWRYVFLFLLALYIGGSHFVIRTFNSAQVISVVCALKENPLFRICLAGHLHVNCMKNLVCFWSARGGFFFIFPHCCFSLILFTRAKWPAPAGRQVLLFTSQQSAIPLQGHRFMIFREGLWLAALSPIQSILGGTPSLPGKL